MFILLAGVATTSLTLGRNGIVSASGVDIVMRGNSTIVTEYGNSPVPGKPFRWGDYSAISVVGTRLWFAATVARGITDPEQGGIPSYIGLTPLY